MSENKESVEKDLEDLEKLGEITNPETNKQRDEKVSDSLIGGTRTFKGLTLRPVTLSTLAMLEKLKSPLVTGEEGDNVIEALIFLWIQSEEMKKVRAATLTSSIDSRMSVENAALELGDSIGITDMQEIVEVVSDMMNESQKTKVVQIPSDDHEQAQKQSKNK